jgi:MFS family permease
MTTQNTKVPAAIVSALALTQIIGYGTLFYSFSIIAPLVAKDLGASIETIFAIYTVALFLSGMTAPYLGKLMDRYGGALVMSAGSLAAAITLATGAISSNIVTFGLLTILAQIAGGMIQYQAAFTTLVETRPHAASRSIMFLTLFAGFASSIFWPFATYLTENYLWQEIYFLYASLNLLICMPLHLWINRCNQRGRSTAQGAPVPVIGTVPSEQRRSALIIVAIAFGVQGFTLSAILTHMVPMLSNLGLGALAVIIGVLFGPSQAVSRLATMLFTSKMRPSSLATLSSVSMVIGTVVLGFTGNWIPGAIFFAICLGLGSGISSIAQGALPLWLFGSKGYGGISGRIAAARLVAASTAPFIFSVLMEKLGTPTALLINAVIGVAGIIAFVLLSRLARHRSETPKMRSRREQR